MRLNDILSDSFRYPLSDVKKTLTLGLLFAAGVVIFPLIFAYGYVLRIMEYSLNGSEELPPFDDWKKMFGDGLKFILTLLIYLGIPYFIASLVMTFVLIAVMVMSAAAQGALTAPPTFNINQFLITFYSVMAVVLAIPYALVLMALPHMVKKQKIDATFEFRNIIRIIKNIGVLRYLSGILILAIFLILFSTPGMILNLVLHVSWPITLVVTFILALFIGSYIYSFGGRLLALLYMEGLEERE